MKTVTWSCPECGATGHVYVEGNMSKVNIRKTAKIGHDEADTSGCKVEASELVISEK